MQNLGKRKSLSCILQGRFNYTSKCFKHALEYSDRSYSDPVPIYLDPFFLKKLNSIFEIVLSQKRFGLMLKASEEASVSYWYYMHFRSMLLPVIRFITLTFHESALSCILKACLRPCLQHYIYTYIDFPFC